MNIYDNLNKKNNKINKKGITFLMLIVTLSFILIVTSSISVSFISTLNSVNKKDFASEINAIQKMVDQYYFKNDTYPIKPNDVVIELNKMSDKEKEQFSDEFTSTNQTTPVILKELDFKAANIESITRGLRENNDLLDVYAVSTKTGKVYYAKGKKINKTVYYTLIPDLKECIKLK